MRIDSIFAKAVKKAAEDESIINYENKEYRIVKNENGWPRLSYGPPFRYEQTRVRHLWIKPDCLLLSTNAEGSKSAIVIEVCKSWQNFMSKRYQYCAGVRAHLKIFSAQNNAIELAEVQVIYALSADIDDWLLSRVVNIPDCGSRFIEGIGCWGTGLPVNIQYLVTYAVSRAVLLQTVLTLPNNDPIVSAFPSLTTGQV